MKKLDDNTVVQLESLAIGVCTLREVSLGKEDEIINKAADTLEKMFTEKLHLATQELKNSSSTQ